MQVIDSEGRLFGFVNVVDAMVVLLVGAVLLAGAAVVVGPERSSSPSAAYATLTVDSPSEDTSRALVAAENLTLVGTGVTLPVADAVRRPTAGGDAVRTIVRVRLPDDAAIYPLNRTVRVTTGQVTYETNLSDFGTAARIARQTRSVVVRATVPRSVADAVTVGDRYRIGNRTVARVDSVAVYPAAETNRSRIGNRAVARVDSATVYPVAETTGRRLSLELTLRTVGNGQPQYLGRPIRLGTSIPFETADYRFEGTIVNLGASGRGTPADATLRVEWSNVRPALADTVRVGMAETHRGANATITDVAREPATVVLRTEDGRVYAREHPVNEDVTLTLSVRARRHGGTLYFHGRPVQSGNEVVLDFGSVTVRGTVLALDTGG